MILFELHGRNNIKEEVEEDDYNFFQEENMGFPSNSPLFLAPELVTGAGDDDDISTTTSSNGHQFSLVAALRKSLVMCTAGGDAAVDAERCRPLSTAGMEIGRPTDVRHVVHVTFDRFGGFLGLPEELEPEVPRRVPSASVSVFGVSVESMQCSFDKRGNSVPTILLSMQRHLYSQGGLLVEGIFRITAENSQELLVRDQLDSGIVPEIIDPHCLAGLIKAWFRELPRGVLDSLTPDQVMHCNSEEDCTELVRTLPQTEAAILDWAINLMADVVEHEHCNKMNARNISMVFAPNMTQMADPLTALVHAVQVMNFLKTLIMKTLQEREESVAALRLLVTCSESSSHKDESESFKPAIQLSHCTCRNSPDVFALDKVSMGKFLFSVASKLETETKLRKSIGTDEKCYTYENHKFISQSPPLGCEFRISEGGPEDEFAHEDHLEGALSRMTLRKGMWKLCRHSVFQLSRSSKKLTDINILRSIKRKRSLGITMIF